MKFSKLFLTVLSIALFSVSCKDNEGVEPESWTAGYTLIWADEFDGSSINPLNWVYETGDGTDYDLQAGWGNNEEQIYTTDAANSGITMDGETSALYITALKEGNGYTSAKLTTQNLFSMLYGRVEVRAKLPEGQGIWPAIWMLGANIDSIKWPGCGEIDIMECLGNEPSKIYSTIHYTNKDNIPEQNQGTYTLPTGTFSSDYHRYGVDWTPENITFYVDGNVVKTTAIEADMKEFLRSFYLVLNVAVGGNWPGSPDDNTMFPQTMMVDYVRAYQKDGFEAPTPPALVKEEEQVGQEIEGDLFATGIRDGFDHLGVATLLAWGGGGQPKFAASSDAINGDFSLLFNYPGGNWGGGYFELKDNVDLSSFSTLNFSLKIPSEMRDVEVKLEGTSTNAAVFIKDYVAVEANNGFKKYSIPLSDFKNLDLTEMKVPFSMWNPKDDNDQFVNGIVLLDDLYFE